MDMPVALDADLRARIAALVKADLEARRVAISRELATIPPPVPACDVDFNRLLEDRGRVADELQQLHRLLHAGASAAVIAAFCRVSPSLGDAVKREIDRLLGL